MTTQEEQEHATRLQRFSAAMRRRFPTLTGVVSLASETRTAMKAEHEALHRQARKDRQAKG